MFTKVCTKCGLEKNIDLFYKRKHPVTKLSSSCKTCRDEDTRRYYKKNRERLNKSTRESKWRRQGINVEIAKDLLSKINACEICGSLELLYPDHCHSTGIVRGVLCRRCNFGIGQFKDDVVLLNKAVDYLSKHVYNN